MLHFMLMKLNHLIVEKIGIKQFAIMLSVTRPNMFQTITNYSTNPLTTSILYTSVFLIGPKFETSIFAAKL